MRLWTRFVTGLICIPFALNQPARADVLGWLGGSTIKDAQDGIANMMQKSISQLLDGFDKTSHSLLDQGAHDGNLLLVQGGNEMQLVVASARAQFGSEMSNQVSQASAQLRPYLVRKREFLRTFCF